jgi:DpnI-like restriction endonuclease/phospholipase D-like protein
MIIVSPTDRWIRKASAACSRSLWISSPFVGTYLKDRIDELPTGVPVRLLTRTLLADFATRASDLDAVCAIAARVGQVLSLNSLHAKVYIVDGKIALITSANATYSGMHRNAECGFEVSDGSDIRALRAVFETAFGSKAAPKVWTLQDLEALRKPVAALREALPKMPSISSGADQPPILEIRRPAFSKLVEGFSGWLRLTFEAVAAIGKLHFTLDEVWLACTPLINQQFPNNRFPRPKIRQQLQRLRDLGIIRFLGDGNYELLTRPKG